MIAEELKAVGIEFVDAAGAVTAVADQASLLEDAEVLGDGGAGDGEAGSEFMDGAGVRGEEMEDGEAGRVAQSGEAGVYVSVHLR